MKAQMQLIISEAATAPYETKGRITSLDEQWNNINNSIRI
jgi:hypothetical protein